MLVSVSMFLAGCGGGGTSTGPKPVSKEKMDAQMEKMKQNMQNFKDSTKKVAKPEAPAKP